MYVTFPAKASTLAVATTALLSPTGVMPRVDEKVVVEAPAPTFALRQAPELGSPFILFWNPDAVHGANPSAIIIPAAADTARTLVSPPEGWIEAMASLTAGVTPWARRLTTLRASEFVDGQSLVALVEVLRHSDSKHWPTPGVFPGEDGGLRIEWGGNHRHTVFEIGESGEMYAAHFDFDEDVESDLETNTTSRAVEFLDGYLRA